MVCLLTKMVWNMIIKKRLGEYRFNIINVRAPEAALTRQVWVGHW